MNLQTQFKTAQKDVLTLSKRPDNNVLLELYALFKQGNEGDVTGQKPGILDFVKKAKYEAWENKKGMSKKEAMQAYVDLVDRLKK
ncbi:MAG: acyl-CoA-binding protein [Deltaproteobacteria bacterium]|nr:acyl-CoA-binding protein [Deltaproteobacteria bacterium]